MSAESNDPSEKIGKVAITIRSFDLYGPAMEVLKKNCEVISINTTGQRLSERELVKLLRDADGVIAGTEKISDEVIRSSRRLKVISRVGVGLDSVDLDSAKLHGIYVKNTPESPVISVAEHTIGLILSVLKNIPQYNERMRRMDYALIPATLLHGRDIGIIGIGRIGSKVATILGCMGCRIRFYDPFVTSETPPSWIRTGSLESLMADSDIVTLHTTALPLGKPILEEKLLSHAKRGIIIINTARGSVIDERALVSALETGHVAAAALDVFSFEPYDGDLLKYPQVIVTPHVASNTIEARRQMEFEAVMNVISGLRDQL